MQRIDEMPDDLALSYEGAFSSGKPSVQNRGNVASIPADVGLPQSIAMFVRPTYCTWSMNF